MIGKFDSVEAEELYKESLNGGLDDEVGSVSEAGWFGLMDTFILSEDSQGFVSLDSFGNRKEAERAWADVQRQYAEYWGEFDSSNGGHA